MRLVIIHRQNNDKIDSILVNISKLLNVVFMFIAIAIWENNEFILKLIEFDCYAYYVIFICAHGLSKKCAEVILNFTLLNFLFAQFWKYKIICHQTVTEFHLCWYFEDQAPIIRAFCFWIFYVDGEWVEWTNTWNSQYFWRKKISPSRAKVRRHSTGRSI